MPEQILTPLAGGILIGLGASLLLLVNGRVAGISGMVAGLFGPIRGEWSFFVLFLGALVLVGAVGVWLAPESIGISSRGFATLAVSGLLVGVGTRLANGCTSGHGVCGISRLSRRSAAATLTFIGSGIVTVTVLRVFFGAPP